MSKTSASKVPQSTRRTRTTTKKTGNGKGVRRTPRQLHVQNDVFLDSVLRGLTVRELGVKHDLDPKTVTRYLRAEEARRADELGAQRESERARSVATYMHLFREAMGKSARYDEITELALASMRGDVARDDDGRPRNATNFKFTDSAIADAIKARERIDKLLGLDAPTKGDNALERLVDALSVFPEERPQQASQKSEPEIDQPER